MTRTFVLTFSDSGSHSGHYSNTPSQMGAWPVFIFKEAMVFTTLPGKDRLSAIKDAFVEALVDEFTGNPIPKIPGPNKKIIEIVRSAQLEAARQSVEIFESRGLERIRATDLLSIPGAVLVPNEDVERVRMSWSTIARRATAVVFYFNHRDPGLPVLERKRKRNFTFNRHSLKRDLDLLARAFRDTFGSRFVDDR